MMIFPAIDIKEGKCVRLLRGEFDQKTVYFDDPVEAALEWESKGAKYIHIVDLDGALHGKGKNREAVKRILESVNVPLQLGGGIRTVEIAAGWIEMGVSRVILGTAAVKNPEIVSELVEKVGADKVLVSIDAKKGMVCTEGWMETSELEAAAFAEDLEAKGVKTIVYTDIAKDGTMVGPNFDELSKLQKVTRMDIIASGGIGDVGHVKKLAEMGLYGAITGKALYEGTLQLEEALEVSSC
ncbi:MAG: 1-(5-phosphoribosyl)-5-((5-phosphoribosylamino)methylideneamino)imidazole-4-carboxamide isomerase [Clostridiales bacterium]|nr:MAG: 1-(5-phosphoribosyl)-5-((5-phosphoribosylamino)methylideneamino)imidazole-4-carboxamide isomerase [Clostridiales bacterium]